MPTFYHQCPQCRQKRKEKITGREAHFLAYFEETPRQRCSCEWPKPSTAMTFCGTGDDGRIAFPHGPEGSGLPKGAS